MEQSLGMRLKLTVVSQDYGRRCCDRELSMVIVIHQLCLSMVSFGSILSTLVESPVIITHSTHQFDVQ